MPTLEEIQKKLKMRQIPPGEPEIEIIPEVLPPKPKKEIPPEPKPSKKTTIIKKIKEEIPNEVKFALFDMYESYKSRWSNNPNKPRRSKQKQANISIINGYFNFESKENENL